MPVEIQDRVVTMACSEGGHPDVEHDQADHSTPGDGGGKLKRSASHAHHDDRQNVRGVERVPQNIPETHDREHRHEPERRDEVVR